MIAKYSSMLGDKCRPWMHFNDASVSIDRPQKSQIWLCRIPFGLNVHRHLIMRVSYVGRPESHRYNSSHSLLIFDFDVTRLSQRSSWHLDRCKPVLDVHRVLGTVYHSIYRRASVERFFQAYRYTLRTVPDIVPYEAVALHPIG